MALNTTIYLPTHALSHRVAEVIARSVGVPFEVTGNDGKPLAADEMENQSWRVSFPKGSVKIETSDTTDRFEGFCYLAIHQADGEQLRWMFHTETGDFEQGKVIKPPVSPLGIAIGRKLIEFFGGQIGYIDTSHKINQSVTQKRALFPLPTKGQTGDDRWHQFYRALLAMEPLTVVDLYAASKPAEYSVAECNVQHAELIRHLGALERERILEQTLPSGIAPATSKPRL